MRCKHLPLSGAIALSAPSFAVTVNMTDFVYPGSPVTVVVDGGPAGSGQTVSAGEFAGTLTEDGSSAATAGSLQRFSALTQASPTSFMAWCVDLGQGFEFHTNYSEYGRINGVSYFGNIKADALSRLFTAAQGFVVDSATSAAMQAAIWEIEYENSGLYDLGLGSVRAGLQTQSGAAATAFGTVNGFLMHLSNYGANYQLEVLASREHQDFLIATAPVPEPETWALLMAGLGALGWAARRRAAPAASPRASA